MEKIKKVEIFGIIFGVILGSLLHFTYQWSGENIIVGFLSAINESAWEHTKLIFTPIILFMFVEIKVVKNWQQLLKAKIIEILFGIIFIISFFYTYIGAFGIDPILIIDIISFIIAVIIGKYISYKVLKNELFSFCKVKVIIGIFILVLILSFFVITTIDPPEIPLFELHEHLEDH